MRSNFLNLIFHRLQIQGTIELSPDTITWYYRSVPKDESGSKDGKWKHVLGNSLAFNMAPDGTAVKLKKLDEFEDRKLYLKVHFRTRKHDLTAVGEVQMKGFIHLFIHSFIFIHILFWFVERETPLKRMFVPIIRTC